MRWIFDQLFAKGLDERTERYLEELRHVSKRGFGMQPTERLKALGKNKSTAILLGATPRGEEITIPLADVLNSHAMVTGGTGSGKTRFALLILKSLIGLLPQTRALGCCVLDPKGETFAGALYLLKQRMGELGKSEARELRRRDRFLAVRSTQFL
jgi:Helicase HerA, central domain